ncbi:TolC family protein [Luteibacter sp. Lutesp34]|uniref:TolC family protein n=1 Tax=Luteibacter sp. Lutesp34 TaxID=3243030 RepID=UPI0039B3AAC7
MLAAPAKSAILGVVLLTLGACAHYSRLPLNPETRYAPSLNALRDSPAAAAPLTQADVTRLILQNNRSLRLASLHQTEARSQASARALPPNPSFAGSLGYLLSGAGDVTAWTAALAQPINGWITLRARRAEARATTAEVDASLAWEAWQTIAKGRQLVVDIKLNETLLTLQSDLAKTLGTQWQTVAAAEQRGDMDATMTAPMAQAAADATLAVTETRRALATQRRDLSALMGLSFDAPFALATLDPLKPLDDTKARQAIEDLPAHRPDLIALAMGYDVEDARFRAAVLSQFPALSVGYDASQDNSRVTNGGPSVTIDLPIFDRGRAQADAQGATRQRLHDEYGNRVADATDEARALLAASAISQKDLRELERSAAMTPDRAREAADALARGDLERGVFTALKIASLSRRIDALKTELAVREQRIALETLLGIGMPAFVIDKEPN